MPMLAEPGKYFEVAPGIDIYYEDKGSGQPIVFVPGWTFTTELFEQQINHFSKTHRVIALDPRSHGRSTTTIEGANYATHGADLVKLIEALELKDIILVGWSFGCLTQWEYIRQAGVDNLKAAVCIDISPKPLSTDDSDWTEGALDEIAEAHNAYVQSSEGQRGFVTYYATEVMVQRDLTEAELFWINEQSLKTPYFVASNLFASGMFSNYLPEAKQLDESVPTLYVIAEHWQDVAVPFVEKHMPNTKKEVLGGHMMFWEHADTFNAAVDAFLAGI